MVDLKAYGEGEDRSESDRERFFRDTIFQPFQEKIYSRIYRELRSWEPDPAVKARELTMDVFSKAWKQIVVGLSIGEAWLYTVADHAVINHKKYVTAQKRDRRKTTSLDERITTSEGVTLTRGESIGDPKGTPEEELLKKEWMDRVQECLQALSRLARRCFLLHHQEGYSYAVIATLLRTSEGSARASAHYARVALEKCLEG